MLLQQCVVGITSVVRLTGSNYAVNKVVHFVHSPVALAMISFDTLAGTSAYESNTME